LKETASIGNGFSDASAIVDTEMEDDTIAWAYRFPLMYLSSGSRAASLVTHPE
jgi:hypothetical protein